MYLALKARKGMSSFRTKPTEKNPEPQDVNAGQWWRLGDLPDVDIIGDGGEARGVMLNEAGEVMFHVRPSDWIVESSPEVFEKFTNDEFNKHFQMVIRDSLKMKIGDKNAANQNSKKEHQA